MQVINYTQARRAFNAVIDKVIKEHPPYSFDVAVVPTWACYRAGILHIQKILQSTAIAD
jgi:hypothetical protein